MTDKTETILRSEEKAIFSLRELYESYGYKKYRMSKFEEYDLYAENRAFLGGGSIITFNDTHGKLLALKPDVTLSIVKNASPGVLVKEYYNENVYRAIDGEYREIMQVGLECIGTDDLYSTCEVLLLAKKSLERLACGSGGYILDMSNGAFIGGLCDMADMQYDVREAVLKCVSGKNTHDLCHICRENGVDDEIIDRLVATASSYGKASSLIPGMYSLVMNDTMKTALDRLAAICDFMEACGEGDRLNLDFSLINDMNYYDGIIFRGFIEGVPRGILSGGRYDRLLYKMGKRMGAVGFAVYMNELELYFDRLDHAGGDMTDYDVDILITYDDHADPAALTRTVKMLTGCGRSVRVQRGEPGALKYREHFRYGIGGLEIAAT